MLHQTRSVGTNYRNYEVKAEAGVGGLRLYGITLSLVEQAQSKQAL